MAMSRPLMVISSSLAFEFTNPRLEDGMELVKRSKDSLPCQSAL